MILQISGGCICRWLSLPLLLCFTAIASADVYISPSGGGNYSGAQSNPKPATLLQTEIVTLQPGNTIYLLPGTYSTSSLSVVGSGTAVAPKRIVGIPDGSGNLPKFVGTYDVHDASGAASYYVFKFVNYGGAETSHWEFKNLRFENHGHVIDMPLNGETFTLRRNILFENLEMDNIEDGIRLRNAEHVTVRDCSIIRHTKKAFRIGFYTRFITFEDCSTDANAGDDVNFPTRSIPVGFGTDSPGIDRPIIHDLRFIGCSARNNRFKNQGSGNYWNGDGYSTERGVYNVTYSRCISIDNHDGGWDDKAVNVIYENCIALGNKRGFRNWTDGTLINCLSVGNEVWGGNSNGLGSWFGSDTGNGTIIRSTFHNNEDWQVLAESPGVITVHDSILSIDASAPSGAGLHAGAVTLNGSILYHAGVSGTNPNYTGPIANWQIAPPDAFNSTTFPTKGYQGQGTATVVPAAPSAAVATLNAAQSNHIDLTWNDNSTNEAGFRIERSANGGAYTVIGSTGTNATRYMDTGLPHGVSYAYRIYAYNNIGSSSTYASATRSTPGLSTPIAPSGLTATYNPEQGPTARITWNDNSTNEADFQVQRSYDGSNYTVIATVTENTEAYTDSTIPPNTTVYYRIRARNSAGAANSGAQSLTLPWIVIVDNLGSNVEISPTSPAVWAPSTGQPGYWGTNYHANTTPATPASFGFVPAIPSTGSYEVYLRWTSHSNRASSVPVDIIHAGGTSTVAVNQKSGGGVWQLLNTYTFNAGSTGKIVIRNTGVNGAVIADAVYLRAVATGGPSRPTNLTATAASATSVNLSWSDQSNNETGFAIERSTDGSSFAHVGSTAANATSYTDNAAAAGFSYHYRVRAVQNGTRGAASNDAQTFTPLTLTLDNVASSQVIHTPGNGWISSTTQPGAHNGEYVHDDNSSATTLKTILFRPSIPSNGTYQVQARWTAASNRATNVRLLINGTLGRQPVLANQTTKHNQWVTLGTFTFRAGTSSSVLLTNEGANGYVIGDAVRFIRVAP